MATLSARDIGLVQGVAEVIHELEKQIERLEQRIVELEAGSMKYCGVHQASIAYRKGNVVTYDGSAWCATRDVSVEKPGHGDGWQLMVKHGKDAPGVASPRCDASTAAHARNGSTLPPSNPRMR
jgi:hypothetical protein